MAQTWFIEDGGRVDGPLTARQLQARAGAGRLRPADRVSPDRVKWVRAEKVKGLKFASAPVAPARSHPTPPAQPVPVPNRQFSTPQSEALLQTVATGVDQVPGYEILASIGGGACGVVFRARQLKLDRVVALKAVVVPPTNARVAIARFEQEAVALAKLRHPNIVAIYDSGHHDERVYFAMELLDGEDLCRRIDRTGPLDERTAWGIARQTAAGLAHAAEHGVYHRDIKPANLFLVPPPTGFPLPAGVPMVKVTDFGLALTRSAEGADQRLTNAGVVLGTPVYMAPEQFARSDIDHRADIYSLGATVYHALTGQPPFDGVNVWDVMVKKTEAVPRPGEPVSAESADLVAAMMAVKPAERIGSYAELIARIDELPCMRSEPATVARPRQSPVRNRWRVYATAAVAGLVLAGGVVLAAKLSRRDRTPDADTGRPPARSVTFVSAAPPAGLFNGESVAGWAGPGWSVEIDDERVPVLTGTTGVRRSFPLPVPRSFRAVLALDLHKATAAEVVIAVGDGPPESAPRWSLRITRDGGAVLGRRDGERGPFHPLAEPIPFPTAAEAEGKPPYQEVRYDRAGGKITVWFRTRPVGNFDDDGTLKATEIRLVIDGGPVRIESASVQELREPD